MKKWIAIGILWQVLIAQPNGTNVQLSATCTGSPQICTLNANSVAASGTASSFLYAQPNGINVQIPTTANGNLTVN